MQPRLHFETLVPHALYRPPCHRPPMNQNNCVKGSRSVIDTLRSLHYDLYWDVHVSGEQCVVNGDIMVRWWLVWWRSDK